MWRNNYKSRNQNRKMSNHKKNQTNKNSKSQTPKNALCVMDSVYVHDYVCAWVCVCMSMCVHEYVCAWVCVCMGMCVWVFVSAVISVFGHSEMLQKRYSENCLLMDFQIENLKTTFVISVDKNTLTQSYKNQKLIMKWKRF